MPCMLLGGRPIDYERESHSQKSIDEIQVEAKGTKKTHAVV
jgi:hypothetical protein